MLMGEAAEQWQRPVGRGFGGGKGGGFGGKGGDGGKGGKGGAVGAPAQTPPPGYLCYRCSKPGHFIAQCPTNGDPRYDKAVVRRAPVGIPKSMLKKLAPPPPEGAEPDPNARGGLIDRDGSIVAMVADEAQFAKATERRRDHLEDVAVPEELKCPVTHTLFRNAVLLPCCGASVSDDAIAQALVEDASGNGATCSLCGRGGVSVDEVLPNQQLRAAVTAFQNDVRGAAAGKGAVPSCAA